MSDARVQDPIERAWSGEPDVDALQTEFEQAWTQGSTTVGDVGRISTAEDIRYSRWAGQSNDGLKHQDKMPAGKEARPYDGAPDTRIPLADDIVNMNVATLLVAFWGARMNPKPTHISQLTTHEAAELKAIVNWIQRGVLFEQLIDDAELAAQVGQTIGWVILKPGWVRREGLVPKKLTLDEIEQVFGYVDPSADGSVMSALSDLIKDKDMEDAAAEMLQAVFHVEHPSGQPMGETQTEPPIDLKEARRIVRELRETGYAEFNLPVVVENRPELEVLIPYIDFIGPVEMTKLQKSRVIFHRDFFSAADLESIAAERGWARDFVDAVKHTAGTTSDAQDTEEKAQDQNMRMIELVTSYARQVDERGVMGIYCTVFSPNLTTNSEKQGSGPTGSGKYASTTGPRFAEHYLLDFEHGKQPFVPYQTEVIGKRLSDARGVPERLATQQMEMKRQRDAVLVFTELSTVPPLRKIGTRSSKLPVTLGSMAILHMGRADEWSWFPPPAGRPDVAFQVEEMIRREAAHSHGIPIAGEPPQNAQLMQQRAINRWLMPWGQVFWQLAVLCYQYFSGEELTELIGHEPLLSVDKLLKHSLQLWFDARALDNSWVKEMVAQIAEILQTDTGGVIDHAKLTAVLLGYIDPTLADEVAMDKQGASHKVFNDVRNELLQIMNGNEAQYVANDPTARMKLQFLQQILQGNPEYIAQVHPRSPQRDPRKAELLEKYGQNLQQSVMQQDNKQIGRIGVKPENATSRG